MYVSYLQEMKAERGNRKDSYAQGMSNMIAIKFTCLDLIAFLKSQNVYKEHRFI